MTLTSPVARRYTRALVAALGLVATVAVVGLAQPRPATSRVALKQALPALDGAHLTVQLSEVVYEPGGVSPSHQHPCPVVGYVLEGAVRMQIGDRPEVTYRAGETFFENPSDVHRGSANASQTERARFLAYFTCDHEVTQFSVPTKPQGD